MFGLVASAVFQGTNYVGSKLNPQGKKSVQVQSTQTISQNKSSDSEESVSGSTEGTSSVSQVAKNAMPSIVSIVGVSVQEIPQIYQLLWIWTTAGNSEQWFWNYCRNKMIPSF